MSREKKSGLDEFREILEAYRQTLTWALGGSAILPLIASFAGLAPIWPPGVPLLTSLFTLLSIIFCFQFFRKRAKKITNRVMLVSLGFFLVTLVSYLILISVFTFKIPTTGETIYLGCGWSDFTKEIADELLIDVAQGCPGQYDRILETSEYESGVVWTKSSVTAVRVFAVMLWLTVFSFLATFIGSFLVYQSNR